MAKKKIVQEATLEDEKMQMSVKKNYSDDVTVRGKVYHVKWMHPSTAEWITELVLKERNDDKILCQSASLIVLNGFWKCHLLYWLLWRWFYYIKQYNALELTPLFEMAQKKTQSQVATAYLNATIYLTALKDTKKQMTKAEAERTLQELRMVSDGKSHKSTE